jgi:hypothetical protein
MLPGCRLGLVAFLLGTALSSVGWAQAPDYSWTILVPKNDTRDKDVVERDKLEIVNAVAAMNTVDAVFHERLVWRETSIVNLLSQPVPFCELDFDIIKPFVPTPLEKKTLREYLVRGGFLLLCEDGYPYTREEILKVKGWPIIDFVLKELPVADPNFTVERITEKHPLFRQYYKMGIPQAEVNEMKINPRLPDYMLVSYRHHPCVFIVANCAIDDEEWVTLPKPYLVDEPIMQEDLELPINLYVYATMH